MNPKPSDEERRPGRSAPDRPLLPDRTSDEQDPGWGDWREDSGNDDRLREDVPPHW